MSPKAGDVVEGTFRGRIKMLVDSELFGAGAVREIRINGERAERTRVRPSPKYFGKHEVTVYGMPLMDPANAMAVEIILEPEWPDIEVSIPQ